MALPNTILSTVPVQIRSIWISPGHDFRGRHEKERLDHGTEARDSIECHAGKGILHDRYYNFKEDFKGQITFFDEAVARKLQETFQLHSLDRANFRRNVLIDGIDLNTLIGKTFRIGDIVFSGSEECRPCYWMDQAIAPGAFESLKGYGGLRCRIHSSGKLNTGSAQLEILSSTIPT